MITIILNCIKIIYVVYFKLIGSINLKTTQKKRLDDCKLKEVILQAVADNHNCTTSRQIYERIDYHNYNSFRVSLNQYVRRGYLKKEGDKKPYHYSLTKKGYLHAKDPLVLKRERRIRYEKHITQILGTDKGFRQGVQMFIRQNPEKALQEIYKSPYFKGDSIFHRHYKNRVMYLEATVDALANYALEKEKYIEKQQCVIGVQQVQLEEQRILLNKYERVFLYNLSKNAFS